MELIFAPRVWKSIEVHGWKGPRIVWAVAKIGIVMHGSVFMPQLILVMEIEGNR